MRRIVSTPLLAAATLLAFASAGHAQQGNPSAQQIINSLTPSGSLGATRGIRLAPAPAAGVSAPQAAPPAAAAAPPAPPPVAAGVTNAAAAPASAAPSVNLNVEFATNSADLTAAAQKTLDALGTALTSQQLAAYRFRIEGHTDTVGTAAYNLALSQRRADAVAAYLERKFGVAPDRLQATGMGEKGLLVPTPPNTDEPRNRRVQVVNIGS